MKQLAGNRPTTQSERIYALEQARETESERLKRIEDKLDKRFVEIEDKLNQVFDLLTKAKGIKMFLDSFFKIIGYLAMLAGAAAGIARYFAGH